MDYKFSNDITEETVTEKTGVGYERVYWLKSNPPLSTLP